MKQRKPTEAVLTAEEARRIDLGACCYCGTVVGVVVLVNMDGRCPILGRGWGCVVCELPPHGAVAVLCDGCAARMERGVISPRMICTGYPARDGRTPVGLMQGSYRHDVRKHVQGGGGFVDAEAGG